MEAAVEHYLNLEAEAASRRRQRQSWCYPLRVATILEDGEWRYSCSNCGTKVRRLTNDVWWHA